MTFHHGTMHQLTDRGRFVGVHDYPLGIFTTPLVIYTAKPCITLSLLPTPLAITSAEAIPSAAASMGIIPLAGVVLGDAPEGATTTKPTPKVTATYEEC